MLKLVRRNRTTPRFLPGLSLGGLSLRSKRIELRATRAEQEAVRARENEKTALQTLQALGKRVQEAENNVSNNMTRFFALNHIFPVDERTSITF